MPYSPPTFTELRDAALEDYRDQVNGADVGEGSEIYARATVIGGAAAQVAAGLRYVERQIFPDSADSTNLERHAGLYGLERLDATAAGSGTVELTGVNGTVVASGLSLVHADGTEYVTTAGGTIASGVLEVAAEAVTTGSAGNKPAGDELVVQSPPAGVYAAASVASDFSGGTDDESDAELLLRVLDRMRFGSAGGTAHDYEQWAGAVDGVMHADCHPLRRGPGTVTVAVYTEGVGGVREPADSTLRAAVAAYIDTLRPVTAEVDCPAITEAPVDVTVEILEYEAGYNEATVRAAVGEAIAAYIYTLRRSDALYRSRLGREISAVAGVLDYDLTAPAANVAPTIDSSTLEALVPGTVTVT